MELSNLKISWLYGQTIGNGCCGYHALAESFVRVARHTPENINPQLFEKDNAIYRPVQEFLCYSLELKEFTPQNLQAALSTQESRNSSYIKDHVAPAMLILLLSHHRNTILPLREAFVSKLSVQPQALSLSEGELLRDRIFVEVLEENLQQNNSALRLDGLATRLASYKQILSQYVLTFDSEIDRETIDFFDNIVQKPVISQFLNQSEERLDFLAFQNLFQSWPAFSFQQYPHIAHLHSLLPLLFEPVASEHSHGVELFYYPCAVYTEEQLAESHRSTQYAVVRRSEVEHFEYAISAQAHKTYQETPNWPSLGTKRKRGQQTDFVDQTGGGQDSEDVFSWETLFSVGVLGVLLAAIGMGIASALGGAAAFGAAFISTISFIAPVALTFAGIIGVCYFLNAGDQHFDIDPLVNLGVLSICAVWGFFTLKALIAQLPKIALASFMTLTPATITLAATALILSVVALAVIAEEIQQWFNKSPAPKVVAKTAPMAAQTKPEQENSESMLQKSESPPVIYSSELEPKPTQHHRKRRHTLP